MAVQKAGEVSPAALDAGLPPEGSSESEEASVTAQKV
jgi:hypothetical protein